MSFLIAFAVIVVTAGIVLLPTASVVHREHLRRKSKKAAAQRHCMEEATRLLQSGAPDYEIEVWLSAAKNPIAAQQKRSDGLPGYGLVF